MEELGPRYLRVDPTPDIINHSHCLSQRRPSFHSAHTNEIIAAVAVSDGEWLDKTRYHYPLLGLIWILQILHPTNWLKTLFMVSLQSACYGAEARWLCSHQETPGYWLHLVNLNHFLSLGLCHYTNRKAPITPITTPAFKDKQRLFFIWTTLQTGRQGHASRNRETTSLCIKYLYL